MYSGNLLQLMLLLALYLALLTCSAAGSERYLVGRQQKQYKPIPLTQERIALYSSLTDDAHLRQAISNIAIPRVVGSDGHTKVREYIINSLDKLNWNVDLHKFYETVPILGKLYFQNIVAKLNPNAERYLVLACHYDSKYMQDVAFVGATDSAVPCAMLLNLAHVLQNQLNPFRNAKVSLMFIFFDGEEAFKEWTKTDSIYGARHLAHYWEKNDLLDKIDLFVLLDLLGAPDPKFYNFFSNTESWYARLIEIEERFSHVFHKYSNSGLSRSTQNRYFQAQSFVNAGIEDDHLPFLQRNVPILHLIPVPFPSFWHTEEDNESSIDYATTENLALIIRVFTCEYLLSQSTN